MEEFSPTIIDPKMIREMHAAIPRTVLGDVTWAARMADRREISSHDPDALLEEIRGELRVEQISLSAFGKSLSNRLILRCELSSVHLSCEYAQENEMAFSIFTNFIKGMFGESRDPIPAESKTVLELGNVDVQEFVESVPDGAASLEGKSRFWQGLNRQRITEDIISRTASHLVIGLIGGAVGYFLAQV
jgi:hypothetical protein